MKSSGILNKIKAAAVSISVLAAALVSPGALSEDSADAAESINYAKALQYSLYLYDANMCGSEVGEKSQLDWRDDCHTYDSKVSTPYGTMDLSGGYHDAGDHAKFGLPAAYSATMLGWGYYEFKDAYTQTGQANHLKTITDYFCDYFKRCTVFNGTSVKAFCYQVGDGNTDHDEWKSPESQTLARPAYFADSSNPCTDVVAETAAALAMNYLNFKNEEDLYYAKALYEFAKTNNKGNPNSAPFYQGTCYLDDLALASIILYKATGTSSYKTDCANWISQSNWAYTTQQPLCWDSVWPAVNAIDANERNRVAENIDVLKGKANSEGYACHDNWGSARYNTAEQLICLVYDKYNNSNSYTTWAKGQMEYLFGNNKLGNCYMVGYSSNSVKNPHHRAATGFTNFPSENKGKEHAYVLVGALVGGPDRDGNYYDVTDEYHYTEVSVDYNAGFVGALAGLYLKYGSGQSVDSSIPGVSGSTPVVTTPAVTTTPVVTKPIITSASTSSSSSATSSKVTQEITTTSKSVVTSTSATGGADSGTKVVNVNTSLNYSSDNNKMYKVNISDLVPSGAKAEKFIIKLSANGNIGSPSIGGGISVTNNTNNWLDLNGIQNISGSSGTIEFDVSSIKNDIQYDGGIFQIGYWWGEQSNINVDSITCIYTSESQAVTTASTAVTTRKTTVSSTVSTKITAGTTTAATTPDYGDIDWDKVKYGDVNQDGYVDSADIVVINKYLLSQVEYPMKNATAMENADCDRDGEITTKDSFVIINCALGLINESQIGK